MLRSIPAALWLVMIALNVFMIVLNVALEIYDCKFFLATGIKEEEQAILNEIMQSHYLKKILKELTV